MFSTLFVWYTQPLSDKKCLSIGFHKTCHFFRFQGIANISSFVFQTCCLIYPTKSDKYFPSIGFHKTCHFFRFQGLANISSYVFLTFWSMYPALSEDLWFFEKVNSQNFIHYTDPVLSLRSNFCNLGILWCQEFGNIVMQSRKIKRPVGIYQDSSLLVWLVAEILLNSGWNAQVQSRKHPCVIEWF